MKLAAFNSSGQKTLSSFWWSCVFALLLATGSLGHGAELAWDAASKECVASFPEQTAKVQFVCTNITSVPVMIMRIRPSCGCMTRVGRELPLTIPAGGSEQLIFEINLRGKSGKLSKQVEVFTDKGEAHLEVRVLVSQGLSPQDRMNNLKLAEQDRQSVFQGQCAGCHATPAEGKTGGELFRAACGICHAAQPRASMVPDLRGLHQRHDANFWRGIIKGGRQGSLMPGFERSHGGPLTDEQIESLVQLLAASAPAIDASRTAGGESQFK